MERRDLYAPSSLVIITSEDKDVFQQIDINFFQLEGLNPVDATNFVNVKAFKSISTSITYFDVVKQATETASWNPLILKVI